MYDTQPTSADKLIAWTVWFSGLVVLGTVLLLT
jgi:hypothetical protein